MNSEGNIYMGSYKKLHTFSFMGFLEHWGPRRSAFALREVHQVLDAGRKKVSLLPRYATKKYTEESSETENI